MWVCTQCTQSTFNYILYSTNLRVKNAPIYQCGQISPAQMALPLEKQTPCSWQPFWSVAISSPEPLCFVALPQLQVWLLLGSRARWPSTRRSWSNGTWRWAWSWRCSGRRWSDSQCRSSWRPGKWRGVAPQTKQMVPVSTLMLITPSEGLNFLIVLKDFVKIYQYLFWQKCQKYCEVFTDKFWETGNKRLQISSLLRSEPQDWVQRSRQL